MTDKEIVLELCKRSKFIKVDHYPQRFQYQENEFNILLGPHASGRHVIDFVFDFNEGLLFQTTYDL